MSENSPDKPRWGKHYHVLPSKYFDGDISYEIPIFGEDRTFVRLFSCLVCAALVSDTCTHEGWHEHEHV